MIWTPIHLLRQDQREQAIGCLYAGQRLHICVVRNLQRPRHCTVPQQHRSVLHQHLQNRFIRATETAYHVTGTHNRLVGADTV